MAACSYVLALQQAGELSSVYYAAVGSSPPIKDKWKRWIYYVLPSTESYNMIKTKLKESSKGLCSGMWYDKFFLAIPLKCDF